jgi:hypothetical protein
MRRYLVRKQNLRIIGPLTFDDLRKGISTMEITLSDEVCCSLSPWVFLEDLENSRYVYPELGDLIVSGEDVVFIGKIESLVSIDPVIFRRDFIGFWNWIRWVLPFQKIHF